FFFSSRRRHTRSTRDWSSDVCSSDLVPSHFEFSHGNLAKYVVEVMDRAGVQAAHVVGAKTGGAIAMHLAADFPTRVRSLVVVGEIGRASCRERVEVVAVAGG